MFVVDEGFLVVLIVNYLSVIDFDIVVDDLEFVLVFFF